jgi:DNA polymerase V
MLTDERISQIFPPLLQLNNTLPFYTCPVSACFPSPSDDYLEGQLDLNQHLIKHPVATCLVQRTLRKPQRDCIRFFVRAAGDSMIRAGIHTGDLLIVDRSLEARDGRVIIAVVNGELLVKRLMRARECVYLVADNPDYPALLVTEAMDFQVWGVVTNVVHPL